MRHAALWRDHGEVTRALLAVGVVLLAGFGSVYLLHVPEPPLVGMDGSGWKWVTAGAAVLEVISIVAGLLWLGALALVFGALVAGAWALLVVDPPWLYDPAHLRLAILGLIFVLVVALIVVAREFSVVSLRIAALATIGVVAMLAVRLGRLEAREDLAVEARAAATTLDVQLAALVTQPSASVASLLSASDGERDSTPATTTQQGFDSPTERAQSLIGALCRLADGEAFDVNPPVTPPVAKDAKSAFVAGTYQRCLARAGPNDDDPRRIGRPSGYDEARTAATWAVLLVQAEVEHVAPAGLTEARSAAVAAAGGPDHDGTPVDLLTTGGEVLVSGLPGIGDPDVPATLTLVGWVVLVGGLVLGYRWLEILNGHMLVGPVAPPTAASVQPDEPTEERLAELRRHIVRNIPEPGAIPGAETLQPVTDLVEATGDPSSAVIRALLKLVGVLFPKTGYTVEASFAKTPRTPSSIGIADVGDASHAPNGSGSATAASAGPRDFTVTVLLKEARTGAIQTTIVETNASEHLALKAAGYRVAAYVLSQSSRVPRWARWDESNAAALCKFTEAHDGGSASIDELEEAVRTAPASGVLLALLGHRHDLDQRPARALSCYLRAAALYPRYPVARYRVAISFSLLAAADAERWTPSRTLLAELHEAFIAFSRTLGISWDDNERVCRGDLTAIDSGLGAVVPLACIGDHLLEANAQALSKLGIAHQAFRRSERSYWLTLLFRFRSRAESSGFRRDVLAAVNESARVALRRRAGKAAEQLGDPLAGDHRTAARAAADRVRGARRLTWQVDYNLACAASIEGRTELAMDQLRGLVRRPHIDQLTRAWAESDPDLANLRCDEYLVFFERFLSHLRANPTTAWTALVDRYARSVRTRFGGLAAIDSDQLGKQAVYAGDRLRPVPLRDLRETGEMATERWLAQQPRPSQLRPPKPLKATIDRLLVRERKAAFEALCALQCRSVRGSDLTTALDAGRSELGEPPSCLVIATPASFSEIREIISPTGARVICGPAALVSPLLIDPARPPLTQFVAQDLQLEHSVGERLVRFVVHERIGFAHDESSDAVALVDHC
jgi:hypothetical protein